MCTLLSLSSADARKILTIRLSAIVETVAASWPRIRADPRSLADADENGDVGIVRSLLIGCSSAESSLNGLAQWP